MSSIFRELCQVFSASYVKYLVTSYVKFLQKCARGSEGTVTCVYTCVLRVQRTKPSTQPMGICVWESRDLLVYIECSLNRPVLIGYHSVSKGFSSFGLIWHYFVR